MKRLIPFDGTRPDRSVLDRDHMGKGTTPHQWHCRLPLHPDPRRTAFHAVITGSEDGLVFVREIPLAIVQFRDTGLAHLSYLPPCTTGSELLVTVTENTCYDVEYPYRLPEPETPVIIVGLDVGGAIEAEIVAGSVAGTYYRPLLIRYQETRSWYQVAHAEDRSRRQS